MLCERRLSGARFKVSLAACGVLHEVFDFQREAGPQSLIQLAGANCFGLDPCRNSTSSRDLNGPAAATVQPSERHRRLAKKTKRNFETRRL